MFRVLHLSMDVRSASVIVIVIVQAPMTISAGRTRSRARDFSGQASTSDNFNDASVSKLLSYCSAKKMVYQREGRRARIFLVTILVSVFFRTPDRRRKGEQKPPAHRYQCI